MMIGEMKSGVVLQDFFVDSDRYEFFGCNDGCGNEILAYFISSSLQIHCKFEPLSSVELSTQWLWVLPFFKDNESAAGGSSQQTGFDQGSEQEEGGQAGCFDESANWLRQNDGDWQEENEERSMVPRNQEPVGFAIDSDSEHNHTFHLQRVDLAAHELQQNYFKKPESTAEYLGSILEKEEFEQFLKRLTWSVRRWLKANDPSYAPCHAEIPLRS